MEFQALIISPAIGPHKTDTHSAYLLHVSIAKYQNLYFWLIIVSYLLSHFLFIVIKTRARHTHFFSALSGNEKHCPARYNIF